MFSQRLALAFLVTGALAPSLWAGPGDLGAPRPSRPVAIAAATLGQPRAADSTGLAPPKKLATPAATALQQPPTPPPARLEQAPDLSCCAPSCCCAPCDPKVVIGDLFSFGQRQTVLVPGGRSVVVTITNTSPAGVTTTTSTAALLRELGVVNPYAGRQYFKIAQNESVLPQDRVFLGYSYLHHATAEGVLVPQTFSRSVTTVGTVTTTTNTLTSEFATPGRRVSSHHELLGFERTFFDGSASVGVRAPFFQQRGDGSLSHDDIGDISLILKALLLANPDRGTAVSGGLMVTFPTGPAIQTYRGEIHSTLLQPYLGAYWQRGNAWAQGFSSLVVPTDTKDVMLWLNSLSVGYTVVRRENSLLRSLSPVIEVHVTTPLNHRGPLEPIAVPDIVNLTGGLQVEVGPRGLFTVGVTTPVTGEHPFDLGVMAAYNQRF